MSERAVSEVVSYVLVFGLVVSAVGIVSVSGLETLQDRRDAEQMENAERAFDVLADNVADIHRRGAPSRATEINLGEAELATGANVTVQVGVDEGSGSFATVVDRPVRPVVYSGEGDRRLVYEAGAVFRTGPDGGVRVHDPPFVVHEERVFLPVVGLNSPVRQTLGGSTVLVRTRERATRLAYNDTEATVERVRVRIRDSAQQSLWNDYLSAEGFSCTPSGDTLTCVFDPGGTTAVDRVYVVDHDINVSNNP